MFTMFFCLARESETMGKTHLFIVFIFKKQGMVIRTPNCFENNKGEKEWQLTEIFHTSQNYILV